MRILLASLVFVGTLFGSYDDEPNERQMRNAFAGTLALNVRNALDFIEESAGTAAVDAIRKNGTDRFEIITFQKIRCTRASEREGHVCAFHVDVGVENGALQRTLTGRFVSCGGALAFNEEV